MSGTSELLLLIHEAEFDEENCIIGANASENEKTIQISTPVKRICGHIESIYEKGNEIFTLKCNFCEMEWEISKYGNFVNHIEIFHYKTETGKKPSGDLISFNPNVYDKVEEYDGEIEISDTNNEAEGSEQFDDTKKRAHIDDSDSEEMGKNEKNFYIREYEPESKKIKKETNKRQNGDGRSRALKQKMVLFDHPEEQCVLDYLELINSNPILWHRRASVMKSFDEALEKCTFEFNTKWPKYQMTYEQSRASINSIKYLYQRVLDPTHKRHIKNSTHLKKYPKYFHICGEIEKNSKKLTNPCDHCRAFFFNEIDLQVHKYKFHRIGELPFKCSRCKYGFSKAEILAEHEQKHHRSKRFTCEICNKGFFDESKLQTHEAVHSNDYKPVCEICGKIFTTQSKYRRHRLHHEPPKEKCEICGKVYYEKWNLSEHIKSHRNERLYHCDICGKTFNHQNDVTIHKRGVHNLKSQPRKYIWVNKNSLDDKEDEHELM